MKNCLTIVFVLLAHIASCQDYKETLEKALGIESNPFHEFDEVYVGLDLLYKGQEYTTITRLSFLLRAYQIENNDLKSDDEKIKERLIDQYDGALKFKKQRAFKNISINDFTEEEIAELEDSPEFEAFVSKYKEVFDLKMRFEMSRHIPDSLEYFVENDIEIANLRVFECDCDYMMLIQLLWQKGIIVQESNGAVSTKRIYNEEEFFTVYNYILE